MPPRKSFLLRIDPTVLDAVQKWADDDLRSLNAQVEFLLRRSLSAANRFNPPPPAPPDCPPDLTPPPSPPPEP